MASEVTFSPDLAPSVAKPSHPSRKRKVHLTETPSEEEYGPLALAILLPRKDMLARLVAADPEFQQIIDKGPLRQEIEAVEDLIIALCNEAAKIWPNAFGPLIDTQLERTSGFALGLADNLRRDCSAIPTKEQILQIRERCGLVGKQYKLRWFEELYPDDRLQVLSHITCVISHFL